MVFDIWSDQTFSSNILHYKIMFDHFPHLAVKTCVSREKATNQKRNLCNVSTTCCWNFGRNAQKVLCAHFARCLINIVCPYSHGTFSVTNMMLHRKWTNYFIFSWLLELVWEHWPRLCMQPKTNLAQRINVFRAWQHKLCKV